MIDGVRARYDAYIAALRAGGAFTAELRAYERAYAALDAAAKELWDLEVERSHEGAARAARVDPAGRPSRISDALRAYNEKKRAAGGG